MSQNIFGGGGDQVNLASQMKDCSMDQLDIIPGDVPSSVQIENAPGMIEVQIGVSLQAQYMHSTHQCDNPILVYLTNRQLSSFRSLLKAMIGTQSEMPLLLKLNKHLALIYLDHTSRW